METRYRVSGRGSRVASGILALVLAGVPGCGSDENGKSPTETPGTRPALPATRAGAAFGSLLALVNGPVEDITTDAVAPLMHATLRLELSAAELAAVLTDLAQELAPLELSAVDSRSDTDLRAVVVGRGEIFLRVQLAVAGPGTAIAGLQSSIAPDLDPAFEDRNRLEARVAAAAPSVSAQIAAIEGGVCSPLASVSADARRPLGSLFKIYVLGALVDAVAKGEVAWSDPLAIRDEWKSLPSGELQMRAAGTELSLQDYANGMMEISDNTATDHLIHHLGRERVEAHMAAMGHALPELNAPLFTTRELFWLKLVATEAERSAYLEASPDARRAQLDAIAELEFPADVVNRAQEWTLPRSIESLEWFASPSELCRAFAWLDAQRGTPAGDPALAALARNPGTPADTTTFSYVGYKGGSEPGVLAVAWLLRLRADDTVRFVTLLSSDREAPIRTTSVLYHAVGMQQFAATTP